MPVTYKVQLEFPDQTVSEFIPDSLPVLRPGDQLAYQDEDEQGNPIHIPYTVGMCNILCNTQDDMISEMVLIVKLEALV